jgi:predicted TIM-barrel fold metal-dependent hydrolase
MIDRMPVIDAVVHAYNMDPRNRAGEGAETICEIVYESVRVAARPGFLVAKDDYLVDWTIEEVANMLFLESSTDLAVTHVLPIYAFKDGLCSLAKAVEAQRRWPNRFLTYCGVDPMMGPQAMEEMERQVEALHPVGLKLYPNSWAAKEVRGWKMDDPEIAFPFFERARQLGLKVIGIHKAVPLGPVPLEHYRVDDVDRAAIAFPDLNFEVIHGGMAFLEETAWQLARFPNVFANLEITTSLLGLRVSAFRRALGTLLSIGGETALRNIVWGTGAMAFHPQPFIDRFARDFQFSSEQLDSGVPAMTERGRRLIFAENYARMVDIDLNARLAAVDGDEFAQRRAANPCPPFSTTHVGDRAT